MGQDKDKKKLQDALRQIESRRDPIVEMATSQINISDLASLRTSCAVSAITDEDLRRMEADEDEDEEGMEDAILMDIDDHDATMQLDASMLSQGFAALMQGGGIPPSTEVAVRQDALVAAELSSIADNSTNEIDMEQVQIMAGHSMANQDVNDTTRPNFGKSDDDKDGTVRQDMNVLLEQLRGMASRGEVESMDPAAKARIENLIAELSSVVDVTGEQEALKRSPSLDSFPAPGPPADPEEATVSMSGLPSFDALGAAWPNVEDPTPQHPQSTTSMSGLTPQQLASSGLTQEILSEAGFSSRGPTSEQSTVSFSGLSDAELVAAGFSPDALEEAGFSVPDLPPVSQDQDMLRDMLNSAIENATFEENLRDGSLSQAPSPQDVDYSRRLVPTVAEAFPPQAVRDLAASVSSILPPEADPDSLPPAPALPGAGGFLTEAYEPVPSARNVVPGTEAFPSVQAQPEPKPDPTPDLGPAVIPPAPMKVTPDPPRKSNALVIGALLFATLLLLGVAGGAVWFFLFRG